MSYHYTTNKIEENFNNQSMSMSNCKVKIAKIVKIDINRMLVRKKNYQLFSNLLDAFLKTRSAKAEMQVSKELSSKTSRITKNQTRAFHIFQCITTVKKKCYHSNKVISKYYI